MKNNGIQHGFQFYYLFSFQYLVKKQLFRITEVRVDFPSLLNYLKVTQSDYLIQCKFIFFLFSSFFFFSVYYTAVYGITYSFLVNVNNS